MKKTTTTTTTKKQQQKKPENTNEPILRKMPPDWNMNRKITVTLKGNQ